MGTEQTELEVDARGRVTLGKLRGDAQRFAATKMDDGEILLVPVVSISARELALLKNPATSRRLRSGIAQAKAGKVRPYEPPPLDGDD